MLRNSPYAFEICVESADTIAQCVGLADRIELCAGLDVGGLTPDIGMMECAAASGVETHVLIRPRNGDLTMTADDMKAALAGIRATRQIGLKGVVIGAERDGALDRTALEQMVAAAGGMDVTLHRVIDVVDDPCDALETAIELGAVRVLTSGGAASAVDGVDGLNQLHAAAAGRIEIMAGSGINSASLQHILDRTQLTSFHASCTTMTAIDARYADFGFGTARRIFDVQEAQRIVAMLQSAKAKQAHS